MQQRGRDQTMASPAAAPARACTRDSRPPRVRSDGFINYVHAGPRDRAGPKGQKIGQEGEDAQVSGWMRKHRADSGSMRAPSIRPPNLPHPGRLRSLQDAARGGSKRPTAARPDRRSGEGRTSAPAEAALKPPSLLGRRKPREPVPACRHAPAAAGRASEIRRTGEVAAAAAAAADVASASAAATAGLCTVRASRSLRGMAYGRAPLYSLGSPKLSRDAEPNGCARCSLTGM